MTLTTGRIKDLEPGDEVIDGNTEYVVHTVEQHQGRLLVVDTDGGVHPYSSGSVV